jgi:nicotinamide-nucleotide amidase
LKASIITIGNEVLKGRTVNTNFAYIGNALTYAGYEVWRGIVVRDIEEEIIWAVSSALEFSDLIVTSGGLGPTYDDMSIAGVSRALGLQLELNQEALSMIKEKYMQSGVEITKQRIKMAMLPSGAKPLPNPVGTAPGVLIQLGSKRILCLPGVPAEMKGILDSVIENIRTGDKTYLEKTIRLNGIMESAIAPLIEDEMKKWGGQVYIKSHPGSIETSDPYLDIEVSSYSSSKEEAQRNIDSVLKEIEEKYRSYIGK